MTSLAIVGGGRMGSALLAGLLRAGYLEASQLAVIEKREAAREVLAERFPGVQVLEYPEPAEGFVLAVKPADLEETCKALAPGSFARVLSVVAGATTSQLERWLFAGAVVIRAMPNMPALIGAGASAIGAGARASEADLAWAESILSAIGVVVRLPEYLIDSVTGLSGSGPAYVFLVAEALIEAGVLVGLDREVAKLLTVQTILGSAQLLAESGESAEALRHAVTSPGGTTAAGLRVLEHASIRAAFLDAVSAAMERSRILSEGH